MRGVATATALQVATIGIMLVERVVLSGLLIRAWGLAAYEDWTLLINTAGMLSVLEFGLSLTFSNAFTERWQKGDWAAFQRFAAVARTIALALLVAGILVLVGLLVAEDAFRIVGSKQLVGAEGLIILALLGIAILLQNLMMAMITIYRSQNRLSRGYAANLSLFTVRLLAVTAVVLLGSGPIAAACAYLATTAAYTLIGLPLDLMRNLKAIELRLAVPTRGELADLAHIAPWFAAQNAAIALLNVVPVLVIAHISAVQGGIASFVILRTLTNMARQIINALSNSIAIEFAQQRAASSQTVELSVRITRATRMLTVLNAAVITALYFVAEPFVVLWSGGVLQMDRAVALMLGSGYLVSGSFLVVSLYLNYIGEPRIGAFARFAQAGVTLLVGGLAVAPMGVLGVALGLSAGEAVGAGLVYIRDGLRHCRVDAFHFALSFAADTLAGVLPIALVGWLLSVLHFGGVLADFTVRAAVLGAAVAIAVAVLGLARDNRRTVLRMLRGARGRKSGGGAAA